MHNFLAEVPSCIQRKKDGKYLSLIPDQESLDNDTILMPSFDTECTKDNKFAIKEGNIIHVPSGRCLITDCESINYFKGLSINVFMSVWGWERLEK